MPLAIFNGISEDVLDKLVEKNQSGNHIILRKLREVYFHLCVLDSLRSSVDCAKLFLHDAVRRFTIDIGGFEEFAPINDSKDLVYPGSLQRETYWRRSRL